MARTRWQWCRSCGSFTATYLKNERIADRRVFRLRAHAQAEEALRAALAGCVAAEGSRESLERALSEWLQTHPFFELAYVTNAAGRQVIDNLVQKDGQIVHDPVGFGRDWSDRPWYLAARATREPISTDIYRSTATQDYCFTVAAEIWACGPGGMLKALAAKYPGRGGEIRVSLEARMACGMGGCLGCTVPTVTGSARVCAEGPVFTAGEVKWDELPCL